MKFHTPRHLTYSNTVSTAALVLALAGGGTAAVAAGVIGKNDIKSKHIAAGAVKAGDLAPNSVTSAKVATGSIGAGDLAQDAVGSQALGDKSVASNHLADQSVAGNHLVNNSVTGAAVNESTLGEVPSAASLRGLLRVSVDAQGRVVDFHAPKEPIVNDVASRPAARSVTFPEVGDVSSCSILAGVAQNLKGRDGVVAGVATAWPGNAEGSFTVETASVLDLPAPNPDGSTEPPAGTRKPFTLLVMC